VAFVEPRPDSVPGSRYCPWWSHDKWTLIARGSGGKNAAPRSVLLLSLLLGSIQGAALCARELLELLAGLGWACRAFCGPHVDYEEAPECDRLLRDHGIGYVKRQASAGRVPVSIFEFRSGGVGVQIYDNPLARTFQAPTQEEGFSFLALFERVLDLFRPDILLTYGGHWLAQAIMARAKRRGIAVVFGLYNFAYLSGDIFRDVDAVWVLSRFAEEHYRRMLGIDSTPIPGPLKWERVRCGRVRRRFVTFVNPQPTKGVFVFARIAAELARRRPDIPLLVVEGRGTADWLQRTGVDIRGLGNVSVMANTNDPREFYRLSKIVLMPSLWRESFGRVAAEAMLNGIPVLASNRGALPETLAEAGFLFDIPERYTENTSLLPTAEEVAPWIDTIIRLWDDRAFYEQERHRCLAAAKAWRPERLLPRFEELFQRVTANRSTSSRAIALRMSRAPASG
jgi:glycosyltransferase involved in cell wall biosynthesis